MVAITGFFLWIWYIGLWWILFFINMYIFQKIIPYTIKQHIWEDQNKALGRIIRWQIIGQALMIASVLYFLGFSMDTLYSKEGVPMFLTLLKYSGILLIFWILGIILYQWIVFFLSKILPLQKEILIDQNESIAFFMEGLFIAIALIISISLYA